MNREYATRLHAVSSSSSTMFTAQHALYNAFVKYSSLACLRQLTHGMHRFFRDLACHSVEYNVMNGTNPLFFEYYVRLGTGTLLVGNRRLGKRYRYISYVHVGIQRTCAHSPLETLWGLSIVHVHTLCLMAECCYPT